MRFSKLREKNLISVDESNVKLASPPALTEEAVFELRGSLKYREVLFALAEAQSPLWKSDLYAQVDTDLNSLRQLQQAGLVRIEEKLRYRDPLMGRTYPVTHARPG